MRYLQFTIYLDRSFTQKKQPKAGGIQTVLH